MSLYFWRDYEIEYDNCLNRMTKAMYFTMQLALWLDGRMNDGRNKYNPKRLALALCYISTWNDKKKVING